MINKKLIEYLRENPTSEIMCRAADVIESQERIISEHARTTPSASELSAVIREITGCPDIKRGDESMLVKLLSLFHLSQGAQPPVSQPTIKESLTVDEREAFEFWASDEGEHPAAVERSGACYLLSITQAYWMAWSARAALAKQASGQDVDLESAAKTLADCMDYPWDHMPEQGRYKMRNNARRIIADASPAGREKTSKKIQ